MMSDFKTEMHQIQFRLGLRPRPRWGAYSDPQAPLLELRALASKGREGQGGGGQRMEGKGRKWDWAEGRKEMDGPFFKFLNTPLYDY